MAAHRPCLLLQRHGIDRVIINLHRFPDGVMRYFGDGSALGMDIEYSVEEELLGTAGGVKNNESFLGDETFLVVSGDALTDIDFTALVATHRASGGLATLAVKQVADPSLYGVVVTGPDGRVVGFQEKPSRDQALSHLCNCGIYVFEPAVLDRIPAGAFYDFGSGLFPEMVASKEQVFSHRVNEYWNDVGSLVEYRQGNFDALAGRVRVEIPGREERLGLWVGERTHLARNVRVTGPVLIGSDCRIEEGAVLTGPLVVGDQSLIGRRSRLTSAICWGGLFLGEGCRLANTVIGGGARVLEPRTVLAADLAVSQVTHSSSPGWSKQSDGECQREIPSKVATSERTSACAMVSHGRGACPKSVVLPASS